jgi:hypothetical protein
MARGSRWHWLRRLDGAAASQAPAFGIRASCEQRITDLLAQMTADEKSTHRNQLGRARPAYRHRVPEGIRPGQRAC